MAEIPQQQDPQPIPKTNFSQLRQAFQNIGIKVIKRAFQSFDFVTGVSGWFIGILNGAGYAEFQNGLFRGTFNIGGSIITIDNTQNIQTYLDIINTAGGGTLYLKPGTYTLTSAGITMYDGVALIGSSATNTFIDMNSTSGNINIAGTFRYSTGTITSITSGVSVTGSGTSWLANVVAGRDSLFINGQWMIIASVNSDTSITLAEGYDGATIGAGSAYRISTVAEGITLSNFTVKNSTGAGLAIADARYISGSGFNSQSNNLGITYSYVTEFQLNEIAPILNTSHGISGTNGGRWNWNSVNAVSNGGSGIVYNSVRSAAFYAGVGNSNTADGFNITSCTDLSFTTFNTNANGSQGVECVSGNISLSFVDMGATGNTSDGIKLTATTDYTQILGGDFESNGGYGINIAASTCDYTQIISPVFVSNSSGTINDSGTNTSILPQTITDIQIFTTSGAHTWTKPTGAKTVSVTIIGGGGGGGGDVGNVNGKGGGGGGAINSIILNADLLTPTVSVTIGAKGTGGSGASGTDGGDTTFGSYLTAGGGKKGLGGAAGQAGGAGGTATGGIAGGSGGAGGGTIGGGGGGAGGSNGTDGTTTGAGGPAGITFSQLSAGGNGSAVNTNGISATDYGGGGGGAGRTSGANTVGGDGGVGYAIITTYF